MIRKFIFSVFVLIFIIGIVSAVGTDIKIKTLPNYKVSIFVYPNEKFSLINSFHIMSDGTGIAQVTHSSEHSKIDILVKVTKDGKNVLDPSKFEGYDAGTPVYIRYDFDEKNGEYSEIEKKNETEVNVTEDPVEEAVGEEPIVEETSEKEEIAGLNPPATGGVVSDGDGGFFSWMIYGGIGLLLIVGLVVLFIWKSSGFESMRGVPSPPKNPASKSAVPTISTPTTTNQVFSSEEITKLENKLEETQREIRMLKNKEKIREAEDRVRQDSLELDKLRRGEV